MSMQDYFRWVETLESQNKFANMTHSVEKKGKEQLCALSYCDVTGSCQDPRDQPGHQLRKKSVHKCEAWSFCAWDGSGYDGL